MGFYLHVVPHHLHSPPQDPTQLYDDRVVVACIVGLGLIVVSLLLKWGVLQQIWVLIGG